MNYPTGYITPSQRTADQEMAHIDAMVRMPRFQLKTLPRQYAVGEIAGPLLLWNHPAVVSALGFEFPGVHQLTGSCVGAGFGNVAFSLSAVEVIRLSDPEKIVLPFWLYTYGISRMLLGETSEGEGSLGSTCAEAAKTYGVMSNAELSLNLPQPANTDGLLFTEQIEMHYSNGKAFGSDLTTVGKKHLIRTTAPLSSGQEVFDSVMNYYACTTASNWFVNPGTEKVMGTGANQCVVGTLNGNGGHQTSGQLAWNHPELGPMVFNLNQWGKRVYRTDPKTGRADGVWMKISEYDRALRSGDGELFNFSQYDGYPAQYIMTSEADILPKEKP